MLSIFQLIGKSSGTIKQDFRSWFAHVPAASAWRMISDYSLDNSQKHNDAFSFVIVANHDTEDNIASYIRSVAPKDIKSTRSASSGLMDYLSLPVAFSLSFVVERKSNFLRDHITLEAMIDHVMGMRQTLAEKAAAEPPNAEYYQAVDNRFVLLQKELKSKNPPLSLLRKMFLTATFAAFVFRTLDEKSPLALTWITDRDAIFDRYGGITFDIAWTIYQVMRLDQNSAVDISRPLFRFGSPGMDGKKEYAELIRLPDLIAGVLADIRLPRIMFSHQKFPPVFNRLVVDSENHAIVELVASARAGSITARRLKFVSSATSTGS